MRRGRGLNSAIGKLLSEGWAPTPTFALDGSLQEGVHPFVYLLAEAGHLALDTPIPRDSE